jgi:hypothetical protein
VAEWTVTTTDEDIDAALERARNAPPPPSIVKATYHRDLAGSTPEQAADFNTGMYGSHIWWPQLDEGHYLANMLEGRTGNDKWMAQLQRLEVAA